MAGRSGYDVVFPSNRHLSTRVQAFVEWAAGVIAHQMTSG